MFSDAELAAARRNTEPIVERAQRPFDLEHALDVYASGLPREPTRTTQSWRTERWLQDWGCDPSGRRFEGLLTVQEAALWWLAWTHVDRLGDSASSGHSVASLRAAWAGTEPPFDREWCLGRLRAFHAAASDHYDVWALTSMAPAATHLRVLLGRHEALELVLESIPPQRMGAWVEWVGPARDDPPQAQGMRAIADAWGKAHQPDEDSLPGWVSLALVTGSDEVIAAAREAVNELAEVRPGLSNCLRDLARADRTPGAFSDWVLDHHLVAPPEEAREMVARDGDAGVVAIATSLARVARISPSRRANHAASLVDALRELPDPRLVSPILALLDRPDTGVAALRWLRTCGGSVAPALVAEATGSAPTRRAALRTLAELKTLDPAAFDRAVAGLDRKRRERLESATAGRERGAPAPPDLPQWARTLARTRLWGRELPEPERELLPPLTTRHGITPGWELPEEVVDGLLARLSDVRLEIDLRSGAVRDKVPAGLAGLRDELDPASADRFATALFDVWLRSDTRNEDRWAMRSVAFLGGMDALDRLVDVVRKHRQWGTPEDALSCLDTLRRHGSPYAMALLGWLWFHHRAPRIRRHARIELEALANVSRTTVENLLDTNAPDLGFDATGRRDVCFGETRWTMTVTDDCDVEWVAGEAPGRRSARDAAASDEARALLHATRRRVARVTELHARRWERAMVEQRIFDQERWRSDVLGHPVLRQLARVVLWKVCDDEGALLSAVRLGTDLELSGIDDAPESLSPWERIGVVHPAELARAQLDRWNGIFADYELIQPFEQLDRPVFRAERAEVKGRVIETQQLRSRMARHGWEPLRGQNQMIVAFERTFAQVGITARIDFAEGFAIRPIAAGGLVPEDAELKSLTFRGEWGELEHDEVPPAIFSESAAALLGSH